MNTRFNKKGQQVIDVLLKPDKVLTLTLLEAEYEYNSYFTNPNNWVFCYAIGSDNRTYKLWYYVEKPNETELDEIDYAKPNCITDEYNKFIKIFKA